MTKPKNMQYLRSVNRTAILKRLAIQGPASRIALSHELGLSKMTITNIVSEMIQESLIEECGTISSTENDPTGITCGRRRTDLKIPDYRINALGLFIERYQIHCVAMDINGNTFGYASAQFLPHSDNRQFRNALMKLLRKFIQPLKDYSFIGLGISSVGPLDIHSRTILCPTNFGEIHDMKIGDMLEQEFGLPVYIKNGMSASVLAEYMYGKVRNTDNIVYLGLGTGVGAGIINQGRILDGNNGFAGELGHMSINFNGPKCSCGQKGCLEVYASAFSILRSTGYATMDELASAIVSNSITPAIQRKIKRYLDAVVSALVSIANNFDPELIIIGDRGIKIMNLYIEECEKRMNKLMIQRSRMIPLAISSFEEKTPLIGAPSIVFDQVFTRELSISTPEKGL